MSGGRVIVRVNTPERALEDLEKVLASIPDEEISLIFIAAESTTYVLLSCRTDNPAERIALLTRLREIVNREIDRLLAHYAEQLLSRARGEGA